VYAAALFVEARCPGGRDSTHNLLGPLLVVILQVLFSMLRPVGGLVASVDVFAECIIGWWKGAELG